MNVSRSLNLQAFQAELAAVQTALELFQREHRELEAFLERDYIVYLASADLAASTAVADPADNGAHAASGIRPLSQHNLATDSSSNVQKMKTVENHIVEAQKLVKALVKRKEECAAAIAVWKLQRFSDVEPRTESADTASPLLTASVASTPAQAESHHQHPPSQSQPAVQLHSAGDESSILNMNSGGEAGQTPRENGATVLAVGPLQTAYGASARAHAEGHHQHPTCESQLAARPHSPRSESSSLSMNSGRKASQASRGSVTAVRAASSPFTGSIASEHAHVESHQHSASQSKRAATPRLVCAQASSRKVPSISSLIKATPVGAQHLEGQSSNRIVDVGEIQAQVVAPSSCPNQTMGSGAHAWAAKLENLQTKVTERCPRAFKKLTTILKTSTFTEWRHQAQREMSRSIAMKALVAGAAAYFLWISDYCLIRALIGIHISPLAYVLERNLAIKQQGRDLEFEREGVPSSKRIFCNDCKRRIVDRLFVRGFLKSCGQAGRAAGEIELKWYKGNHSTDQLKTLFEDNAFSPDTRFRCLDCEHHNNDLTHMLWEKSSHIIERNEGNFTDQLLTKLLNPLPAGVEFTARKDRDMKPSLLEARLDVSKPRSKRKNPQSSRSSKNTTKHARGGI